MQKQAGGETVSMAEEARQRNLAARSLVYVETRTGDEGFTGSGCLWRDRGELWLLTNAHVLPDKEAVMNATITPLKPDQTIDRDARDRWTALLRKETHVLSPCPRPTEGQEAEDAGVVTAKEQDWAMIRMEEPGPGA